MKEKEIPKQFLDILIKKLYLSSMKLVDLIEYIYIKLNYVKLNYKVLLLSIFEEKDNRISSSAGDYKENKHMDFFISFMLSLFGYTEEQVQLAIHKKDNKLYVQSAFPDLFDRVKTYQISIFILMSLILSFFTELIL